jgi:hypothetical protein
MYLYLGMCADAYGKDGEEPVDGILSSIYTFILVCRAETLQGSKKLASLPKMLVHLSSAQLLTHLQVGCDAIWRDKVGRLSEIADCPALGHMGSTLASTPTNQHEISLYPEYPDLRLTFYPPYLVL